MATSMIFWDDRSAESHSSLGAIECYQKYINTFRGLVMKSDFRKHMEKMSERTAILLREEARKARSSA